MEAQQPGAISFLSICDNENGRRRNRSDERDGGQHPAFSGLKVVGRTETLVQFNRKIIWFKDAAEVFGVSPAARKNS